MIDGSLAHGLDHHIDPLWQARPWLKCLRAKLFRVLALGRVTAGRIDTGTERLGQRDRGGGHAPAGALHEHTVAIGQTAPRGEHAEGRQPGGRQAGRVCPIQTVGLGHEVAGRNRDEIRERARVLF